MADNPLRTTEDMWGLPDGGILLPTLACAPRVGDLMESIISFVTQKDVTQEIGLKVRCVSGPMSEINERTNPEIRPWFRAPKHSNAIKRIFLLETAAPRDPYVSEQGGANGARKLMPVSVPGLIHMAVRFAKFLAIYLSLFAG